MPTLRYIQEYIKLAIAREKHHGFRVSSRKITARLQTLNSREKTKICITRNMSTQIEYKSDTLYNKTVSY